MLTTERTCNGVFATFWNGVRTKYTIVNTSIGCSGRNSNVYGISHNGNTKPLGSLALAKKTLTLWIQKGE